MQNAQALLALEMDLSGEGWRSPLVLLCIAYTQAWADTYSQPIHLTDNVILA